MTQSGDQWETGVRQLFQDALTPVVVTDQKRKIRYVNPGAEKLLGYSWAELKGKTYGDLIVQEDSAEGKDYTGAEEIARQPIVLAIKRKDGSVLPAEMSFGRYGSHQDGLTIIYLNENLQQSLGDELKKIEDLRLTLLGGMREQYNLFDIVRDMNGKIIDTVYVDVNAVMEKLYGKSREELIGHRRSEIFGPMTESDRELIEKIVAAKTPLLLEYVKDNQWFELSCFSAAKDRVAIFCRDITERKISEEKFSKVFHKSPGAKIYSDYETGEIIDVNESFCHFSGYSREELIGKTSIGLGALSPEVREELIKNIQKKGSLANYEIEFRGKNNQLSYASLSAEQLEIGGKKYLLSTCIDITERKKAEQQLKDEAEWLQFLNNAVNRLWHITNQEAGFREILATSLRLMKADKATLRLYDSEKQLLRIVAHSGFEPEFLEQMSEILADSDSICGMALKGKRQIAINDVQADDRFLPYHAIFKNSRIHAVQCTPLFYHNGEIIGNISTHSLIPDHFNAEDLKRMELYTRYAEGFIERMRDTEVIRLANLELEEKVKERTQELILALEHEKLSNELKSRFVSMASHEFRTPLTSLLTSVDILEKYMNPPKDGKESKHFVKIRSSVSHLTDILNDFLSLDKLENGGIRPDAVTFDMNDFTHAIISDMKGILRKEQKIVYEFEGEPLVCHDKKIIRNILFNLLSNASKYSGEGQTIGLKVMVGEKNIGLEITDRGIGIPEEEQHLMFTRLFRAGNAANISGTGLGLNIVKKYIDLLEGTISFSSVKGVGTTFRISLPKNIGN